eukprot:CAMPEP_0195529490 /NCGR_PEP_ID=MMETSP0794_2-20130614/32047_1 /TAXON_ID=515487 /ORGANISM="Stephanopyxis turris, Strain CCMP 815" /LENGTH=902 /DNA_ID=CAMNT_0040660801 /DNA_START=209 /DNA_END=2918 /DNA_ORIENTATION=+
MTLMLALFGGSRTQRCARMASAFSTTSSSRFLSTTTKTDTSTAKTSTTNNLVANSSHGSSPLFARRNRLSTDATTYRTLPTLRSSSSTSEVSSELDEEDLDAALDNILDNAILEGDSGDSLDFDLDAALNDIIPKKSVSKQRKSNISVVSAEGAQPIPEVLVDEEDPVDYTNPKFLSTSNDYWIKAGLKQSVIDVLSEKGITKFTPVQGEAFTPIVAGRDVIGRSRTGTGKTLAFSLPSITRIDALMKENGKIDDRGYGRRGRLPSMVVLCPTRELARQVQEEIAQVCKPLGMFSMVFHGGVSYEPQARALRQGLDIVVGTPGRVIDHLDRGNMDLSECNICVLDEADEMLNMGFADDVENILDGIGDCNDEKTQCLLFSATTPSWVKDIGRKYQQDVLHIDATSDVGGARTATTVRHLAVQVPPGADAKRSLLEDIIAVEISKDSDEESGDEEEEVNVIAAAAASKKKKTNSALQQKIFGKTIVFTETKREADELVSGGVFKSLTAQALHGDVGQKQRDATLNAFRAGSFNVLVATDVAARGIDISDVDLVIQFQPPRDTDTYVHRSGRTGRAGRKGISILLFGRNQARDITRIERGLGHGFKFDLVGPPSTEAALAAAAKTSALASLGVPEETAVHFRDAAAGLLEANESAEDVVARCLAAISRRSGSAQSRSMLTGELGLVTVEMSNSRGRPVSPGDVMFTVSKLARMSRRDGEGDLSFESDVGKIQSNFETGTAWFDMDADEAKKLMEFSKDLDAGGAVFKTLREMEIDGVEILDAPALAVEGEVAAAVVMAAEVVVAVAVVSTVAEVVDEAEAEEDTEAEETAVAAVGTEMAVEEEEVVDIVMVAVEVATVVLATTIMVEEVSDTVEAVDHEVAMVEIVVGKETCDLDQIINESRNN